MELHPIGLEAHKQQQQQKRICTRKLNCEPQNRNRSDHTIHAIALNIELYPSMFIVSNHNKQLFILV